MNGMTYFPSRDIFSELLIDDATDGHEVGIAGNFFSVIHPQVILEILAVE